MASSQALCDWDRDRTMHLKPAWTTVWDSISPISPLCLERMARVEMKKSPGVWRQQEAFSGSLAWQRHPSLWRGSWENIVMFTFFIPAMVYFFSKCLTVQLVDFSWLLHWTSIILLNSNTSVGGESIWEYKECIICWEAMSACWKNTGYEYPEL